MAVAAPIALALSVAGGLYGAAEENHAQRQAAKVDEANARGTLLEGEQQALQTRKDERMQAGDMLAAMGGDGVELGSGSSGDIIAESAYQRELEILNIRTRATQQANNLYQSAADHRHAGKAALVKGVFGAAATALQGAADIRAQRTLSAQTQGERGLMGGGTRAVPRMTVRGRW